MMTSSGTRDIGHLQAAERVVIGATEDQTLVGLALSGGGIRSASFCMGVLQALLRNGTLDRVDYLSTVSGGGYIGSTITWLVRHGRLDLFDTFADHMRSRGNYLNPDRRLSMASLAAVVLRTMTLNLIVYGGGLTALLLFLRVTGAFDPTGIVLGPLSVNGILRGAALLAGLFLTMTVFYALGTYWTSFRGARIRYAMRRHAQARGGVLLGALLFLLVIGLLPTLAGLIGDWREEIAASGGVGVAVGAAMAALLHRRSTSGRGESFADSPAAVAVAGLAAAYGFVVLAYALAAWLPCGWEPLGALVAVVLVVGWFNDVNLLSLHRMYRDRLMEAFQPDIADIGDWKWNPARAANLAQLACMRQRPYPILNTNVILADSKDLRQRGRGGDSYILSPLFSGSHATGWYDTTDMFGTEDGLTLATATAVSGAAVNAHTGPDSQDAPMRNPAVAFLMTLFGLQLGYWANNPKVLGFWRVPNLLVPGLWSLLGGGFKGAAPFHMLSDGGHFDNTGVYELIRRRVDTIVAVDGSADPSYAFTDLTAMAEKVRADFGVCIVFPGPDGLPDLCPDGDCHDFRGLKVAKRGWIEGLILYPGRPPGRLVYVKSTLVDGVPPYVHGYAIAHPDFPNQPTADQFFDEYQLESYRALGEAIGAGVRI